MSRINKLKAKTNSVSKQKKEDGRVTIKTKSGKLIHKSHLKIKKNSESLENVSLNSYFL